MSVEVEFITLGDASEQLSTPENRVPSATLRHWTDQMEEFEVHYVLRNNRNERIYYDTDLVIFAYLRDMKADYGRRTTTKDLAYMIAEKGKEGEFELRSREDSPTIERSNKTADLLNQEDIQRLMQSERVKQFIGIVIDETTKNIKQDLIEEISVEMLKVTTKLQEDKDALEATLKKRDEEWEERQVKRDELLMQAMRQSMENNKKKRGFFERMFGE